MYVDFCIARFIFPLNHDNVRAQDVPFLHRTSETVKETERWGRKDMVERLLWLIVIFLLIFQDTMHVHALRHGYLLYRSFLERPLAF